MCVCEFVRVNLRARMFLCICACNTDSEYSYESLAYKRGKTLSRGLRKPSLAAWILCIHNLGNGKVYFADALNRNLIS